MVFNAQANQVSGSSPATTSKSKSSNGASQTDFKGFLKSHLEGLEDLSKALADENTPLNLPELGLFGITGPAKTRPGTLYALQAVTANRNNIFQVLMSLFMDKLKTQYDEATGILKGA